MRFDPGRGEQQNQNRDEQRLCIAFRITFHQEPSLSFIRLPRAHDFELKLVVAGIDGLCRVCRFSVFQEPVLWRTTFSRDPDWRGTGCKRRRPPNAPENRIAYHRSWNTSPSAEPGSATG